MPAGQGVGSFRDVAPAAEVLHAVVVQAEAILQRGVIGRWGACQPRSAALSGAAPAAVAGAA